MYIHTFVCTLLYLTGISTPLFIKTHTNQTGLAKCRTFVQSKEGYTYTSTHLRTHGVLCVDQSSTMLPLGLPVCCQVHSRVNKLQYFHFCVSPLLIQVGNVEVIFHYLLLTVEGVNIYELRPTHSSWYLRSGPLKKHCFQ